MEFSLSIVLDDDATPAQISIALERASAFFANDLRNGILAIAKLEVDQYSSITIERGKLQNATLWRHC